MNKELKKFHDEFYEFIWSQEVVKLVPKMGWHDGGCRTLMSAIRMWLGRNETKVYQVVKNPEELHSEHVLVKVGNWFLDGYGVSKYDDIINTFVIAEGFARPVLREFDPSYEPMYQQRKNYYAPSYVIWTLANLLQERFDASATLRILNAELASSDQERTSEVRYQHYKGGVYTHRGYAMHSETGETLVIYSDNESRLWARPANLFYGHSEVNGEQVKRFVRI